MTQIQNGDGRQALDVNALTAAISGDYVDSGCSASDGTNSMEVDIASGTVFVDGSTVSVSAQTVTLNASDTDPRKDVIYIDSTGTANVATGTPEPAEPSGKTKADTYKPSPPDLSSTNGVVVAEVWVGAGVSDIGSADIRDRRIISKIGGNDTHADIQENGTSTVTDVGAINFQSGLLASAASGDANVEGSNVAFGNFTISSTGSLSVTGVGFKPTHVIMWAYANIDGTDINTNGSGANDINNYAGGTQGYAVDNGDGTFTQQTIHSGLSGQSVNNISLYSSSSECIGIRYGDQDGASLGVTSANMSSMDSDGFTVSVNNAADNLLVCYMAVRIPDAV